MKSIVDLLLGMSVSKQGARANGLEAAIEAPELVAPSGTVLGQNVNGGVGTGGLGGIQKSKALKMDSNNVERMESKIQPQEPLQPRKGTTVIRTCFNGLNALSGLRLS
ncbi:Transmembrane amino acid transporter domain-containing protein [Forsythia ovata]|uniref:Transmembrane amino acid transporter domain-containing protein n=1 Tax=Forsythia ovata TaxID=205694 RepID=A0ABD1XC01_9LAMI